MSNNSGLLKEKNSVSNSEEHAYFDQGQCAIADQKQLNIDNILENKLTRIDIDSVLTKREREILEFVLAGNTNKQIAQKLYRTERTVEYHRNRIMRKLDTHTTIELVKRAIAMGIA